VGCLSHVLKLVPIIQQEPASFFTEFQHFPLRSVEGKMLYMAIEKDFKMSAVW
jgi:hypothetical protein